MYVRGASHESPSVGSSICVEKKMMVLFTPSSKILPPHSFYLKKQKKWTFHSYFREWTASIRGISKDTLIENSRTVRGGNLVEEVGRKNTESCGIDEHCLWNSWFLFFTYGDYPWRFWRLCFRSKNRKPPAFCSDMEKRYMGWALVWLLYIDFVSIFTPPLGVLMSFGSGFRYPFLVVS